MKFIRRSLLALIAVLLLVVSGFVFWGSTPSAPMPEALSALQSDAQVTVKTSPWLEFIPSNQEPTTGYIFYPGAHVDYRAYAPAARAIAAQGYLVVIPPMPLNLAVFASDKASEVIAAYPNIQHWAVGGHSLGGAMAANFARRNSGKVEGLILNASYPAPQDDLSQSSLKITLIYATQDGLATGAKIDAARLLLPASTTWVKIVGGNHSQFGWYGLQSGDGPATIDRPAQQDIVVNASKVLLASLE